MRFDEILGLRPLSGKSPSNVASIIDSIFYVHFDINYFEMVFGGPSRAMDHSGRDPGGLGHHPGGGRSMVPNPIRTFT